MKIFAYYLKTESCDSYLVISENNYADVGEFMEKEIPWEYEFWKDRKKDIPYAEFIKEEKVIK